MRVVPGLIPEACTQRREGSQQLEQRLRSLAEKTVTNGDGVYCISHPIIQLQHEVLTKSCCARRYYGGFHNRTKYTQTIYKI